jgi:hypothetical protein
MERTKGVGSQEGEHTLCSISAIKPLTSLIFSLVTSLSSGELVLASSISVFCNLSLVLWMASSSSLTASSRMGWLICASAAAEASFSPSASSEVWVMEANSSARESLKCASLISEESSGKSACLRVSAERKSAIAAGNLWGVRYNEDVGGFGYVKCTFHSRARFLQVNHVCPPASP